MKLPIITTSTGLRLGALSAAIVLAACGGAANDSSTPPSGADKLLSTTAVVTAGELGPKRIMEKLGRGLIAVRTSSSAAFISWRSLALDPDALAFNVYRSTDGGAEVKLNAAPLTAGTNFTDNDAPVASTHAYSVRPVLDGVERKASEAFTLKANGRVEPIVRIPLGPKPGDGYYTAYVWVGDLDGDGEYDYVIDRIAPFTSNNDFATGNQYLEAYKRDGTRLWQIDMGPSSTYTYNISPGAATLSMGMYDGVTVYDLNGDGKAEVVLKVADGVKFGDGNTFTHADKNQQFVAVLDGLKGTPLATRAFPADFYAQAGRYGTQLGIGYPDGIHPSIYFWGRNRNKDKSFNDVFASWSWKGGANIKENWVLPLAADGARTEASHQMRIIDLDGDGKDEMMTGNFAVNSDGSLRYAIQGVGHGDRFYVGKFNKNDTNMRGYGVQQLNPSGLLEYYYDATLGQLLWGHSNAPGSPLVDNGRGLVGDVDPRFPGYEVWSFYGLFNGEQNVLTEPNTSLRPWPTHMIWWDGDLSSELLNDHKIEEWEPLAPKVTGQLKRLVTMTSSAYDTPTLNWRNPMFFGDILGDWRTEVVLMNRDFSELVIFTTNQPTDTRLYTMAQNPAYRNHMTIKGYLQSPLPDYYMGHDMDMPPRPRIRYPGVQTEGAKLGGGAAAKTSQSGYNGSGFASFPQTGGSAEFTVDGGIGGSQTLAIRYANGSPTPRTGQLVINGVAHTVTFGITGSFNTWSTLSVPVQLQPGANTVELKSTGQFLANIDEVVVL